MPCRRPLARQPCGRTRLPGACHCAAFGPCGHAGGAGPLFAVPCASRGPRGSERRAPAVAQPARQPHCSACRPGGARPSHPYCRAALLLLPRGRRSPDVLRPSPAPDARPRASRGPHCRDRRAQAVAQRSLQPCACLVSRLVALREASCS